MATEETMDGRARVTRWRARQVAEGGKPIGVTLTAAAAQALEALQTTFNWSQREAISSALELAAGRPDLFSGQDGTVPPAGSCLDAQARRIDELESRIEQMEARLAEQEAAIRSDLTSDEATEGKRRLLTFTAQQMLEYGERVSRVQLYAQAKAQGLPMPSTQHEYSMFISYHMDMIREIMRRLKDRTH